MSPAEKLYVMADREEEAAKGNFGTPLGAEPHHVAGAIYRAAAFIVEALTSTPAKGADEELRQPEGDTP